MDCEGAPALFRGDRDLADVMPAADDLGGCGRRRLRRARVRRGFRDDHYGYGGRRKAAAQQRPHRLIVRLRAHIVVRGRLRPSRSPSFSRKSIDRSVNEFTTVFAGSCFLISGQRGREIPNDILTGGRSQLLVVDVNTTSGCVKPTRSVPTSITMGGFHAECGGYEMVQGELSHRSRKRDCEYAVHARP